MKKQINGQISLFDYIAEEEQKVTEKHKVSTRGKGQKEERKASLSSISLFGQCKNCWCSDCKHNEKLNAVPRDFSGVKKACPSCGFCIQDQKAEICEIGSYDNGCRLRAMEEGITEGIEN